MHVVFHSPGEDRRTIELFGDAAEIRVERVARRFVAQQRPAVFGGEDEVDVNGGKGLWHGARMADWDVVRQPANGVRQSNAPTGHRPPAQRCGDAATLG